MTRNGQECPKNRVLGLFKKITSLVSSGMCVKGKFLNRYMQLIKKPESGFIFMFKISVFDHCLELVLKGLITSLFFTSFIFPPIGRVGWRL